MGRATSAQSTLVIRTEDTGPSVHKILIRRTQRTLVRAGSNEPKVVEERLRGGESGQQRRARSSLCGNVELRAKHLRYHVVNRVTGPLGSIDRILREQVHRLQASQLRDVTKRIDVRW